MKSAYLAMDNLIHLTLRPRNYYKPFQLPWAYDLWKKHEMMHWLPSEVDFREDINDWNFKLNPKEKNLLTHIFRFFTQADLDVASGYTKVYLPQMGIVPELTMMMSSFAAREAIHIDAYSTLIETVGMPESDYKAFLEYQEMRDKHEFVTSFSDGRKPTAESLAVYSGFTEGMQLFSSFAILMNFERFNKMKGMCNIVRWSIRDESMHVDGMTRLFREVFLPTVDDIMISDIRAHVAKMVMAEDKFIELCFQEGDIEGLSAYEVKQYIRFLANKRWNQLGFAGELYNVQENPLPWLDWVVNGVEHVNFFEARPTDYSKGSITQEEVTW